jgi:hypothetical protein
MSTEINDLVTAAIQKYAADLPNPDFKLNLLAAAEDMAPKLIETLGLKQEWAVIYTEDYGDGEVVCDIRDATGNRDQAYNELNDRLEQTLKYPDADWGREYVGTRMFSEYTEEEVIVLTPEEQHQMDIDQGVVSG